MNIDRPIGSGIVVAFFASAGALTAWVLFHTFVTLAIVHLAFPLTWPSLRISMDGNLYIKSMSTASTDDQFFEYKNGVLREVTQIPWKEIPPLSLNLDPNVQNTTMSLGYVYQVRSSDKLGQRWFSVAIEPSSLYFEGFDIRTRQRIAFIGKEGFTLQQPEGENRFSTATRNGQLSIVARRWSDDPPSLGLRIRMFTISSSATSGDRIVVLTNELPYAIDPFGGSVEKIQLPESPLSATSWQRFGFQKDGKSTCLESSGLVFRGKDTVYLTDENDKFVESFSIPEDFRERPFDLYLPTSSSTYLLTSLNPITCVTEIIRLDSNGNVIGKDFVDLPSRMVPRPTLVAWESSFIYPALPLLLYLDLFFFPPNCISQGFAADFSSAQSAMFRAAWPSLLLIALLSLGLAIWTYRRHQQYDRKSAIVWSVFVFLVGPAGLVGYLVHRTWPAREMCLSCGELARVDRMACNQCGAEFPLPARNGSEILVPA